MHQNQSLVLLEIINLSILYFILYLYLLDMYDGVELSNYFYKVSLLAWFSNWVNYCITYVQQFTAIAGVLGLIVNLSYFNNFSTYGISTSIIADLAAIGYGSYMYTMYNTMLKDKFDGKAPSAPSQNPPQPCDPTQTNCDQLLSGL